MPVAGYKTPKNGRHLFTGKDTSLHVTYSSLGDQTSPEMFLLPWRPAINSASVVPLQCTHLVFSLSSMLTFDASHTQLLDPLMTTQSKHYTGLKGVF